MGDLWLRKIDMDIFTEIIKKQKPNDLVCMVCVYLNITYMR